MYKRVIFQEMDDAIAYMNKSRIPKTDIVRLETVKNGMLIPPTEIVELIYYQEEEQT